MYVLILHVHVLINVCTNITCTCINTHVYITCIMYCIIRGHNELDDPSMTQPVMYKHINSRSSVPDNYWEGLKVWPH